MMTKQLRADGCCAPGLPMQHSVSEAEYSRLRCILTCHMPDLELIAILQQGTDHWNAWRLLHAEKFIDLAHADLCRLDLSGADLRNVQLRSARLREVSLTEANLTGAHINGADLTGVNLDEACLNSADLRGAYLMYASARRAHLNGANLNGANLTGANMQGADWTRVLLLETVLADTNLYGVTGLETCDQPGPCLVDYRTVVRSQGLPVSFLRACGLPDDVIRSYQILKRAFPSCFISYAHQDEEFAQRLYCSLQETGVRCWFAPEHLRAGARIRPTLDQEIQSRDKFLVVLSTHSIRSAWVEKEVETAFERAYQQGQAILIPIRLDDAVLQTGQSWAADIRRTLHMRDFRNWREPVAYQQSFARLLQDLAG